MNDPISITNEMWQKNMVELTRINGHGGHGIVEEVDPIWTAQKDDYLTKVEAENTYAPLTLETDKHYTYTQITPNATWNIKHDLDNFPSVLVVDSANTQVEGQVVYEDSNNITITFSGAFSGKAYLN